MGPFSSLMSYLTTAFVLFMMLSNVFAQIDDATCATFIRRESNKSENMHLESHTSLTDGLLMSLVWGVFAVMLANMFNFVRRHVYSDKVRWQNCGHIRDISSASWVDENTLEDRRENIFWKLKKRKKSCLSARLSYYVEIFLFQDIYHIEYYK